MDFLKFYFENFLLFGGRWWWLVWPFVLYPVMFRFWIFSIVAEYYRNNKFYILNIKVPREQERSPRLMENVIHGIWTVYGELNTFMDTLSGGVIQDYISFEIIGIGGEVRFCVWALEKRIDFIKSHIYAQYPDAEIEILDEDYLKLIPDDTPNDEWDLWGLRWTIRKSDAYPIRTYFDFQDTVTGTMVDPIAAYMEVLSDLNPGEILIFQLLAEPVKENSWEEDFQQEVERILDRGKYKKKESIWARIREDFATFPKDVISAMFTYPQIEPKKDEEKEKISPMLRLSPGEQDTLKAMERSLSKRGYMCQYVTVYLAKKEVYRKGNIQAMMGCVNQFNTVDLNMMDIYKPYMTSTHSVFQKRRLDYIKRRTIKLLKKRQFSGKRHLFNTEELASLWHFPDLTVQAPGTPRVAAKKVSAPAILPTEE